MFGVFFNGKCVISLRVEAVGVAQEHIHCLWQSQGLDSWTTMSLVFLFWFQAHSHTGGLCGERNGDGIEESIFSYTEREIKG